jgi:hypothetical protein
MRRYLEMRHILCISLILSAALAGCAATGGHVTTTRPPGAARIPVTVGLYPLLTTEVAKAHRGELRVLDMFEDRGHDQIYITAPAESKLVVTLQSQMMSDILEAELSYTGFKLKQLPVGTPVGEDSDEKKFVVSLELLETMREDYGLRAVLIGNVYFGQDRYQPGKMLVRAAHVKVVDAATLDVLCHISLAYDEGYFATIEEASQEIAAELGAQAGLSPPEASGKGGS